MSITVPLYGFGGSGDGTGGKLIVTAPAGVTVTISKDGKTKTKVSDAEGIAVFKGLATGDWTVTITDGAQTATKTVTVTADYSTDITFFSATINVTYPAGSTCTATDGVTTLTAPDTSGFWACVVENAGEWTFTVQKHALTWKKTVSITNSDQTIDVEFSEYVYDNGAFADGCSYVTKAYNTESWTDISTDKYLAASGRFGGIYLTPKIDMTPYTTLTMRVSGGARVGVSSDGTESGLIAQASASATTETEYTVDISGVNEEAYITFTRYSSAGTTGTLYLYYAKLS